MKKTILLSATALIITFSEAQILTQATHAPAVGDVYNFQNADPASLPSNLGNPGSGNTFNFAGLNILPGNSTSQGVSVASTGSTSTFPNANVAVKTGTNNVFYNSQASYLDYYGGTMTLGGYSVFMNFSSPARIGTYPLMLGTTNSNTVAGTIYAMSNNGNFVGTNSFTADATGSLVVPGGVTYTNVIRIQTQQVLTFTSSFFNGTLTVNQYDYYAPNYSNAPNPNNNWPVITIQTSTILAPPQPASTQTVVVINQNYQTLQVGSSTLLGSGVLLSPNPAQNELNIQLNTQNTIKHISVMDVSGKIVDELKDNSGKIDCSLLSNGIYFIRLEDNEGKIYTEKFVVQH